MTAAPEGSNAKQDRNRLVRIAQPRLPFLRIPADWYRRVGTSRSVHRVVKTTQNQQGEETRTSHPVEFVETVSRRVLDIAKVNAAAAGLADLNAFERSMRAMLLVEAHVLEGLPPSTAVLDALAIAWSISDTVAAEEAVTDDESDHSERHQRRVRGRLQDWPDAGSATADAMALMRGPMMRKRKVALHRIIRWFMRREVSLTLPVREATPETDPIEFLTALRPNGPWNLTAITPDGPIASATFTDPDDARAWIGARRGRANLYYVVNPAPEPSGSGGRVNKPDIRVIENLHVDIDCDKLDNDLSLDQRKAIARTRLDMAEQPPTFITDTGGGLQAVWKLAEPMPATPENIERAEGANRWLVEAFGGDHLTTDISRLLRLPSTINHPDERKRSRGRVTTPTRLLSATGELHDREAFGLVKRAPRASVTDAEAVACLPLIEEVTDIDALIARYGLSDRVRAIIVDGRAPGEVKEYDDTRDKWLFDGCCQMVRAGVPVGVIAGVLLNSEWEISGHVYDHKGRETEVYAMRQALRARATVLADQRAEIEAMGDVDAEWLKDDAHPEKPEDGKIRVGGLTITRFSNIEMVPLRPLWPDRFYRGKLNIVVGDPERGKSTFTCDMGARVSRGAEWPDGSGRAPLGTVIYLVSEDDPADTVKPRLMAAGADMNKVLHLESTVRALDGKGTKRERMFSLAQDLAALDAAARQFPDLALLVIDAVNSFIGTSKEHDSYRDADVRAVLGPLKEWAERHNVCVIVVTHFRKGSAGTSMDRLMGSQAFGALARSVWAFIMEQDGDGKDTGRRLLARVKMNVAQPADALAYEFEGVDLGNGISAPRLIWRGTIAGSADELMRQDQPERRGRKSHDATLFLAQTLQDGPVAAEEVREAALAEGHTKPTLLRAKRDLGVESFQMAGKWYWRMPETELPTC